MYNYYFKKNIKIVYSLRNCGRWVVICPWPFILCLILPWDLFLDFTINIFISLIFIGGWKGNLCQCSFQLSILHNKLHFVDPAFCSMRSYSIAKTRFFILFGKNLIFRKRLGVATYFCFIFKGKNKIRKKNSKCDSWKKKRVCEKLSLGPEVRLLIRKIQWWVVTPL